MVYKKINVRVNKHEEIPNVIRSLVENNSLFSILTDYTNYSLYRALCKLLLLLLLLIQFFFIVMAIFFIFVRTALIVKINFE